jgi:hypothetical protein
MLASAFHPTIEEAAKMTKSIGQDDKNQLLHSRRHFHFTKMPFAIKLNGNTQRKQILGKNTIIGQNGVILFQLWT